MSTLTRVCGIPRRWFAGVALAWFAVAYLLPLSQEQKLELLEEADAAQRLARIQTFLSALQGELIA